MSADPEAPVASLPGAGAVAARGGALRSAGFALSALLSLVTIPLMVRHLGVADFGRWVSVLALVNVVGLGAELGLGALALRDYPLLGAERRERLLRAVIGLRLALVAAGALVAVAFAAAAGWSSAMVAGTAIASAALFSGAWQDLQSVRLAGELRFGAVTALDVTRAAVTATAVAVLVAAGAGLVPFFAVYVAGTAAAVCVGMRLLRGTTRLRPDLSRAAWRDLLRDAAVYAAATAVYVVYFRVVMLVTSLEADPVETGLFATGFRVVEFAVAIPGLLAMTVLPVLSHAAAHDRERLRRAAADVLRIGLIAGTGAALVLALAAPAVMDVIGGDAADDAVPVLRIQAAAVATSFFAFGTGAALLALRRHREILIVNAAAFAVALVLALILASEHGAQGAAVATVAGECVLVAGQAIALARSVPLGAVLPALAAVLIAAAAAAGTFAIVPLPVVPAAALAAGIYTAIVIASRQMPPQLHALRKGV